MLLRIFKFTAFPHQYLRQVQGFINYARTYKQREIITLLDREVAISVCFVCPNKNDLNCLNYVENTIICFTKLSNFPKDFEKKYSFFLLNEQFFSTKELSFFHKICFLIHISLQPNAIEDLRHFKL